MKTPKKGKSVIIGKVTTYLTGKHYTLSWYAGEERKREMRTTLEDAYARAEEINRDLEAGSGHVRSFTIQETATIENCIVMLRDIGVPIQTGADKYYVQNGLMDPAAVVPPPAKPPGKPPAKAEGPIFNSPGPNSTGANPKRS